MSMPFYVPPEQMMKDRADYARKNIARGRDVIACSVTQGIVLVTENQFRTLYKISELYDRIAFAGVGKYNEFEMLRVAGIRQADLKGYSFAREDVNARALANSYGQTLGQVFTHEMKPYEVEILLAEVGPTQAEDKLYHRHSTYPGGISTTNFAKMQARFPGRALQKAVKGMLPKGPLGYRMFKKLKCYAGDAHPHAAQQPKPLDI